MESNIDEINDGIYRISTLVPEVAPGGFTFNQFLIMGDEPLLFHTGGRQLFPLVAEAVERVTPVDSLRWISFGHVEADECGSVNMWLASAPQATVVHGGLACMVSLNDLCDRAPRALEDGEVLDIGGRRLRLIATPHVPHGWEAIVMHEETTGTLLCGDLFTHLGDGPAVTETEVLEAAVAAEQLFGSSSLAPQTGSTIRALGDLAPTTLAIMHGSSFAGDGAAMLHGLADVYEEMIRDREPAGA
jgi:flavorubredoxin